MKTGGRLWILDMMRFFATLGIILLHFGSSLSNLFSRWYVFVDFFFILSGFVISYCYYGQADLNSTRFIMRRFLRLWPMHTAALIIVLTMSAMLPEYFVEANILNALIVNFFLIQELGIFNKLLILNPPSWSVSSELLINVFHVCFVRMSLWINLIISVSGYLFIYFCYGHLDVWHQSLNFVFNISMIRCAAGFCLGVLSFQLLSQLTNSIFRTVMIFCSCSISISILLTSKSGYLDFVFLPLFTLQVASGAKISSLHLFNKSKMDRIYSISTFCADMTYPLYLLQQPSARATIEILKANESGTFVGLNKPMLFLAILSSLSLVCVFFVEKIVVKSLKSKFKTL